MRRNEKQVEQEKDPGTISTLIAFESSSSTIFSYAPQPSSALYHSCNGSDLNQKARLYESQVSKGTSKGLETVEPALIRCEKQPQTSANSPCVNCEIMLNIIKLPGFNVCQHQSRRKLIKHEVHAIQIHTEFVRFASCH